MEGNVESSVSDLVELDENGEPMLPSIMESSMEDEEFKTTSYANNVFAFNEEKLQTDSIAESEPDSRSTDIEESLR